MSVKKLSLKRIKEIKAGEKLKCTSSNVRGPRGNCIGG